MKRRRQPPKKPSQRLLKILADGYAPGKVVEPKPVAETERKDGEEEPNWLLGC